MSAAIVGSHFPAVVMLDDLAAMNAADRFGHRYELSPQGALSVMPLPDSEHAAIASRIMCWLAMAGLPADQILQAVGIKIEGPDGSGGRIPDLTVWSGPQPRTVWLPLTDLLLAVEIVSPSSAAMDEVIKVQEYAAAGIPRYWLVERDAAQTVTLHVRRADKTYAVAAKMPLAWLLQTKPADHNLEVS
jgi:Uma2 family endonuclease